MKKKTLFSGALQTAIHLGAMHSVCCGLPVAAMGIQAAAGVAAAYTLQGIPYIMPPVMAAFLTWKGRKRKCTHSDHDCPGISDSLHKKGKIGSDFASHTITGYAMGLAVMGCTVMQGHLPEAGPATVWMDKTCGKVIVHVHDSERIWPRSERFFVNKKELQQSGQYIQSPLREVTTFHAMYKLFGLSAESITGHVDPAVALKDYAFAYHLSKEDQHAYLKRKQNLILKAKAVH